MPHIFDYIPKPAESFYEEVLAFMKTKKPLRKLLIRNQRFLHKNSEKPDEWFCNKRTQEILGVLRKERRPMTDRELATALGFADLNAVRPRITEAIKNGYMREHDDVTCPTTGKVIRRVTATASGLFT